MMSRITLSLKREAFRDPDMQQQYVLTTRMTHHREHSNTWDRHRSLLSISGHQKGQSKSDENWRTRDSLSFIQNDEDDVAYPSRAVLNDQGAHELRTMRASPL